MQRPTSQLDTRADAEESTFPSVGVCGHALISITSVRPTEFIDITDRINALVAASNISEGIVNVQALHTTTAILINEHEPLLLTDFETTLNQTVPIDVVYRHDDRNLRTVNLTPDERTNGHAHCRALLLGASVCVNIVDGRLMLGRWQRLFFAELDGPRERVVSTMVLGDGGGRR
jgi:secondary thiamine-phosphate synthase enzyme